MTSECEVTIALYGLHVSCDSASVIGYDVIVFLGSFPLVSMYVYIYRGLQCKHPQCFDADAFIEYNKCVARYVYQSVCFLPLAMCVNRLIIT